VFEVHVAARSVQPFAEIVGHDRVRDLERTADELRRIVRKRVLWNVNTAASGGGVAEMLRSFLRYARGLDVDVRWLVFEGPPEFFRITKRVHNAIHGSAGDGSALGPAQAEVYQRVTSQNAVAIDALVRPGDLVVCHDPQTAGLIPHLLAKGVQVVWRCHIGHEFHGEEEVGRGWTFLRPYIENVPLAVFSRAEYPPEWLRGKRTIVLPPTIDPFSAKNRAMDVPTVRSILSTIGLVEGPPGPASPSFVRDDGSTSRVTREVDVVRSGRPPAWETPLILQVSRWDGIKDPLGVLEGFARFVEPEAPRGAELVLAGPCVTAVADDPEGAKVFGDLQQAWLGLPASLRRSVHLALLPMDDEEENAAIVNALQRHAAVIVQKSFQEGFGLTVTEAMWKRRPVVASAVGGIQDQIRDGVDGLLVKDPRDLAEFAGLLRRVLADEHLARTLGDAAYDRVRDEYLSINALERWAELIRALAESRSAKAVVAPSSGFAMP
jgi:trehalose synthase